MTTVEDKWAAEPTVPQAPPKKEEPCSFGCGRAFSTVTARVSHEQQYHPREASQRYPKKAANPKNAPPPAPLAETPGGPEKMTQSDGRAVHELTRRFVDALDGVAQGMDEKKKARIIQAFDDNAFQINSDPAQLDRFLTDQAKNFNVWFKGF